MVESNNQVSVLNNITKIGNTMAWPWEIHSAMQRLEWESWATSQIKAGHLKAYVGSHDVKYTQGHVVAVVEIH